MTASTASNGALDAETALRAIANPRLRRALELVTEAEISSGALAERCGWTKPAASRDLGTLRDAGLVDVRSDGNRRLYRARTENLERLRAFLDDFWSQRMRALAAQFGDEPPPREPRD